MSLGVPLHDALHEKQAPHSFCGAPLRLWPRRFRRRERVLPVSECLHHRRLAAGSGLGLQLNSHENALRASSREITMHTRKFERMALATFFLATCIAFFGACLAIEHAHAQGTNAVPRVQGRNPVPFASSPLDRAPSMPPPIFNTSRPYTVPQSRETPVSPASPGSVFGSSPSSGVD
jgi:hypothetical protein